MSGPTLLDSDARYSASADNTTLVSKTFAGVANGDVFVVKTTTWDTGNGMAAPTGGGQTWQQAVVAAPGGFAGWAGVWVATISGSPGSITVSSAPATASNTRHSMFVERWSNALLDTTPAVNGTIHGLGNFITPLTTTGANSAISWCMVEENSIDPATRAYLLSATENGIYDGHIGSNSVQYAAYTAAQAVAGSYSFGLSLPTGLNWTVAAVEIKAISSVFGSVSVALTTTATASGVGQVNGSALVSLTTTAIIATLAGARVATGASNSILVAGQSSNSMATSQAGNQIVPGALT